MTQVQAIKYCPHCKKEVAVYKNGNNHSGKQSYKCKCGRQLIDRKYPIEVRSLAVRFHDGGYNYCAIARIFGVAVNTARKWVSTNELYKIPQKKQTVILRKYKAVKDKCDMLNEKINDYKKALKYLVYKNRIKELNREIANPGCFEYQREKMMCQRDNWEKCIDALGDIKYKSYTVRKIRELLSQKETEIKEQEKIKSGLEQESVFARDSYDISEIINIIETLNIKPPKRSLGGV